MPDLIINIPFSGFYDSVWSNAVDREQESYAENYCSTDGQEDVPEELQLDESEVNDALFYATDYSAAYHQIARYYAEAFNVWARDQLGFDPGMKWESMSSPREYNFATDRIFCTIPLARVKRLFVLSRRDNHERLARVIAKRFTSYDGFISGYRNELDTWLAKPLADWDHNELGTLLLAVLGEEPDSWALYDLVFYNDEAYQAWESAVDWERFESEVQEKRDAKAEDWNAKNPDQEIPAPPYRCKLTPDLFAGLAP
jgi:hypothetical protein